VTAKLRALLSFSFCAATLFILGRFFESPGPSMWNISWFSPTEDVMRSAGPADIGSYIQYSDWLRHRRADSNWLAALWPPGMAVLIRLIRTFGENYYPIKLLIVSCLLWTTVFKLSLAPLRSFPKLRMAAIATIILMVFFPFTTLYVLGMGVVMSEAHSTATFLIGLFVFARALLSNSKGLAFFSGVIVALALLLRAYYDVAISFMIAGAFLVLMYQYARNSLDRSGRLKTWDDRPIKKNTAVLLLFFSLGVFLTTVPWRLEMKKLHGTYALIIAGSNNWNLQWRPSDKLAGFQHAANTSCIVDAQLCARVNASVEFQDTDLRRSLSIKTFFAHPVDWTLHRIGNFNWFWFEGTYSRAAEETPWEYFFRIFEGVFFLLAHVAAISLAVRLAPEILSKDRLPSSHSVLFGFVLGFYALSFALFMTIPFETRYSWPARLAGPLIFFWLIYLDAFFKRSSPKALPQ
jgi:hypothetical protein